MTFPRVNLGPEEPVIGWMPDKEVAPMLFRKPNITVLVAALALGAHPATHAADAAGGSREAGSQASWHSPSLTMETVTARNGAVTTQTQLQANALWGLTEATVAEKVTDGVYALRG